MAAAVFTLAGLLALFLSPGKYSEILGRLWAVGRPRTAGQDLQRRLTGLIIALIGAFFFKGAISLLDNSMSHGQLAEAHVSPRDLGSGWLPLGLGLAISLSGLYVLVNPLPVVRWSTRGLLAGRPIGDGTLRVWGVALRLMGALMIYGSIDLFRLWLRH